MYNQAVHLYYYNEWPDPIPYWNGTKFLTCKLLNDGSCNAGFLSGTAIPGIIRKGLKP